MSNDNAKPSGQPYELFMFARKHKLPVRQARAIIERFGADRAGADAAAIAYVGERPDFETWPSGAPLGGHISHCS